MQVRRLSPADAPEYRALRLRALAEHPDAFTSSYEEDVLHPLQVTFARLASPLYVFWGAFQGSELYGMVGLEHEGRAKNRHKGTVIGMYVAPEVSGQGVGRALLAALIAHAREHGIVSLVLTVTHGNAHAQRLYEGAGFRSFGIEPDAVRVGSRSHAKNHMHLDLSQAP
jgi:ribosomal protein S18 acetylase RimI-like enzyme